MTLQELVDQCAKMITKHPEMADMEVWQTSILDDPYRFKTCNINSSEVWSTPDDEHFTSEESAQERMTEDGTSGSPTPYTVAVIESEL